MEKKYLSGFLFCVSALAMSAAGVLAQSACPAARQSSGVCIQAIAWAKNPQGGSCCEYGTPCQAPQGWPIYYSESECKDTQLNQCQAMGQFCGGIAAGAFQCCGGLTCKLDGTYPDASGTCAAGENKCGNGVCETEEAGYCFDNCVDYVQSAANCTTSCVQTTCPQDCTGTTGTTNANPGTTGTNQNAESVKQQIVAIRLQLIGLIQQLIQVLSGMLPK